MHRDAKPVQKIKLELRPMYLKIGTISCSAINGEVIFNMQGWRHLSFHSNGDRRDDQDLRMRLKLFPHVPNIVKNCRSVYKTSTETVQIKGKPKEVTYFELHYSYNRGLYCRIVVLRKIGLIGKVHYWSLRPCNKHKNPR